MGDVSVVFQISPEDVESDIGAIQKSIEEVLPENAELRGFQVKPVAFGLNVLLMNVIIPDATGGPDVIESEISKIDGVSSVEVVDMSLI